MDAPNTLPEIDSLKAKLQKASLPQDLREHATREVDRVANAMKFGGAVASLEIVGKYIDWITALPWETTSEEALDIKKAKEILDAHHYGLDKVKSRILEYISVQILQKKEPSPLPAHAPILFFVGLAGTGKTSLGEAIAQALGRKYVRIPFGGLSSALDLRGLSKTEPEAGPGLIIKALRQCGVKNPVILLDELDRVTPASRDAIMGVLLEILDPGQNVHFTDYFIDYPFDLSQVLFLATANNTQNISTAVLDRLEQIDMPTFTDEDKIIIAKKYVLPTLLKEAGMDAAKLTIAEELWPKLVRPLGFDPGLRSLHRLIDTIIRRAAYRIVQGEGESFTITEANVKEFVS